MPKNRNEAEVDLEKIDHKRVTSTIKLYKQVRISTEICKRVTFATEQTSTRHICNPTKLIKCSTFATLLQNKRNKFAIIHQMTHTSITYIRVGCWTARNVITAVWSAKQT